MANWVIGIAVFLTCVLYVKYEQARYRGNSVWASMDTAIESLLPYLAVSGLFLGLLYASNWS